MRLTACCFSARKGDTAATFAYDRMRRTLSSFSWGSSSRTRGDFFFSLGQKGETNLNCLFDGLPLSLSLVVLFPTMFQCKCCCPATVGGRYVLAYCESKRLPW